MLAVTYKFVFGKFDLQNEFGKLIKIFQSIPIKPTSCDDSRSLQIMSAIIHNF